MPKRVAIVGTAESWRECPWNDPGLYVMSLNDAYTLNLPRVDAWWEMHPLNKMYFRDIKQRVVYSDDVPFGYYVRPQGHLETLQQMARTMPVFLQDTPPAGWPPNAQRFPIEQYREKYGDYWASGPAYMVAWAIENGAEEIQVWGIHLATEHEYREQRPQFEHILGIARGRGIKIVMAERSPVMKHGWQYAYDAKPQPHPAKLKLFQVRDLKGQLLAQLARGEKGPGARDRLQRLEAMELDCLRLMHQREPVVLTPPVLDVAHG